MAKIKQPIKEFWKLDNKSNYFQISKRTIDKKEWWRLFYQ